MIEFKLAKINALLRQNDKLQEAFASLMQGTLDEVRRLREEFPDIPEAEHDANNAGTSVALALNSALNPMFPIPEIQLERARLESGLAERRAFEAAVEKILRPEAARLIDPWSPLFPIDHAAAALRSAEWHRKSVAAATDDDFNRAQTRELKRISGNITATLSLYRSVSLNVAGRDIIEQDAAMAMRLEPRIGTMWDASPSSLLDTFRDLGSIDTELFSSETRTRRHNNRALEARYIAGLLARHHVDKSRLHDIKNPPSDSPTIDPETALAVEAFVKMMDTMGPSMRARLAAVDGMRL